MSRYTDIFESHAFQKQFKNLTLLVEGLDLGDISQPTISSEITRLKRANSYLSEVLNSLDPELAPLNIWDSFQQNAQYAYSEVANYISTRNVTHVQSANAYVDNLLNLVRPYLLLKGKAKSVSENAFAALQKNLDELVRNFQNTVVEKLRVIQDNLEYSNAQAAQIGELRVSIEEFNNKILGAPDEPGISGLISDAYDDIVEKHDEIIDFQGKMLVDTPNQTSIRTEVLTAKTEAVSDTALIAKAKLAADTTINELTAFYVRIFGKLNDEDERVGGLSHEINESLTTLRDLENLNKIRYAAIIENIESLVPSATSAGLAKAYQDMKNSFDEPIRWSSILFYVSVGFLIIFSYFSAITFDLTKTKDGFEYTYGVMKYASIEEALRLNLFKVPLWGALVWLAVFASKRRSEFQRLQQEYAHKEAFASSYISYKQQIEALAKKDTKLQDELIQKMIEAIAFNASQTLDGNHGDKHPLQSVFEKCSDKLEDKVSLSELLEIFKKK